MALIKWNDPFRLGDPFRELATLQDRMNRVLEDTLGRGRRDEELFTGTWAPPVDIVETKDKLTLTAELPGSAVNVSLSFVSTMSTGGAHVPVNSSSSRRPRPSVSSSTRFIRS